jgi:NhaP-type Na+/H+ or K+/H+ antiporter
MQKSAAIEVAADAAATVGSGPMTHHPEIVTSAVAVVAGVGGLAIARRLRLPSILPLLLIGVLLGPSVLGVIDPSSLGRGLRVLVGFGVAIILFEGGLSLKPSALRTAGKAIRNLVTLGALVTWAGCTLLAHVFFPELGWRLAVLFGSLVIVTGPTVIQPLLHVVRPRQRVADVLRGEAILIDPVGALLAVLVLEFIIEADLSGAAHVFWAFGKRLAIGVLVGAGGAGLLNAVLKRPDVLARELRNLAVVAGAIGLYALSETILSESGVLTVTLAGFLLGWLHPPGLEEVEKFKGQLTWMMLSIVFVLLSANLELAGLWDLGVDGLLLVMGVIVLVRPLTIFLCTLGTELSLQEKLFLSWIAPRGIVAAAVSSLFALLLEEMGEPGGRVVMNLTFAVIAGTVIVQAPTARFVGRKLNVLEGQRNGILFVGANRVARGIARALDRAGFRVQLVDMSSWQVEEARAMGLNATRANALDPLEIDRLDLNGIGHMLAVTPSESINRLAVQIYAAEFGRENVRTLRMSNSPELEAGGDPLFLCGGQVRWEELNRKFDEQHQVTQVEVDHDLELSEIGEWLVGAVPLLAFDDQGELRFLEPDSRLATGDLLFYVAPPEPLPEPLPESGPAAAAEA